MDKKTAKQMMIIMISSVVTLVAAWVMIIRLEPGFLLPSRIAESPIDFVRVVVILLLLVYNFFALRMICRRVLKTLKKEREEIENRYKR